MSLCSEAQVVELTTATNLLVDEIGEKPFVNIVQLIGSDKRAYGLGPKNSINGVFVFFKDSSIVVENYNPVYPLGKSYLAKGRYVYEDGIFIMDGIFITVANNSNRDTLGIYTYQKGKLHGNSSTFYTNNRILSKGEYQFGILMNITRFDSLKNIRMTGQYDEKGIPKDNWIYYYTNGVIKAKGKYNGEEFTDTIWKQGLFNKMKYPFDMMVYSRTKKVGVWSYYDIYSTLIYEEIYNKKGVLRKISIRKNMYKLPIIDLEE
jgi:antitoxin component YwqK of YwqJK toxin-antitoxin module